MAANDQLTALDATFLELEEADDGALMHIGAALVFDPIPGNRTPTIGEVRQRLDRRLDLLPRYRQKLDAPRTGGLSWPSWERDQRFEIAAHVRHATLPAPGDEDGFLDWVSDFYSHRLDRSRPLWEVVLLDGLEDGRWALVCKTHHCIVDGVGSAELLGQLLDAEPETHHASGPTGGEAVGPTETGSGWLSHPPAPIAIAVDAGLAAARAGTNALMHPRDALERSRGVIELLVRDELIAAPRSSLNVPIGSTRRIATVHAQLRELQQIRAALGGTVNDVVLSVAAGGLRALLLARGDELPAQGLRAMVPVNVRGGEDGKLGNRVSSLFIDLPVAETEPRHRYELVVAGTKARKGGGQALAATAVTGLTGLAPPVLHASLARSLFAKRLFNVTITNVPGSAGGAHAFGAPMVDVVPIVPIAAEHALAIAVVSYAGGMTFGICADRATMTDLDVLTRGIRASLLQLATLAHATSAAAGSG